MYDPSIAMITAGVDEAGRGPLAGSVVAAAVILNPELKLDETNTGSYRFEKS